MTNKRATVNAPKGQHKLIELLSREDQVALANLRSRLQERNTEYVYVEGQDVRPQD